MDEAASKAAFEWVKKYCGFLVEGLQNMNWQDLPEYAKEQIKNNPKMTVFAFLTTLVATVPGLVATPILTAIGFSATGPVAASLAAWYQAMFGTNMLWSTLQSAAMAGYGAPILSGAISGIFAAAGAAGTWFGWSGTAPA